MKILTILTWKSAREKVKERQFLKFYSLKDFEIGSMIEIIDGNKKSPAIILKSENASDLKQIIRKGDLEIKKLKLSKTGEWSNGKIIDNFKIEDIKKYLKNPKLAQESENSHIKKFFPKKKNIKKIIAPAKTKTGEMEISNILSFEKIKNKEKTYNSEMQELVDTIRNYFHENATFGQGSFSYYIGFFKRIPLREIKQMFAEVKQTKKSTFDKKKLFWWKIGQYHKKK